MTHVQHRELEASAVIQQIKSILVEDMHVHLALNEIPDDYSLLESGLALDSILIAELVTRIEEKLGIDFGERMLQAELFNNLSLLAEFVAREVSATRSVGNGTQPVGGTTC